MKTLRGWLIGASLTLISSAAAAQTYTESCTTRELKGARPWVNTNCTETYTPPPQPFVAAERPHSDATSEIVRFGTGVAPSRPFEHRSGCNFNNTICE